MKPFSKIATRVLAAGAAAFLAATLASGVAYAQPSETIQAARKAVTDGVSGIKEPEAPLSAAEHVTRTRTLIATIITLTGTETDEMVEKLAALPLDEGTDAPLIVLREQFTAPLIAARGYLDALAVVVKDTDTLEGLQAIAGGLKGWREGHGERVRQAADLIVTVQNRTAIETARSRVIRVTTELQRSKFKPRAAQWQPLLSQAKAQLRKATALAETAQVRLLEYLPPPLPANSVDPVPAAASEKAAAPEDVVLAQPGIQDLAQESVTHIRETYKLLIEAIKKTY